MTSAATTDAQFTAPAAATEPTLSVIIPCHDAGRYLAQTLGALLDQTRLPDEVILIDDASTDNTAEIARRFQRASDLQIRLEQCQLRSAAAARNAGAQLARGDLLMFLDADDVLDPEALRGLCDALEHHRGSPAVAICPWQRLEMLGDGRWTSRPASCNPRDPHRDDLANWLSGWYHPTSTVMWTRAGHEAAGAHWDPAAGVNDDGDLMMRALASNVPLLRAQSGLCLYRRDPAAASVSGARCSEAGVIARLTVIERIAKRLRQTHRLDEYRKPLGDALTRLRVDARRLPAPVRSRIDTCYADCGPATPLTLCCARQRAIDARHALGKTLRRMAPAAGSASGAANTPATFGLQQARRILAAESAETPGAPTVTVIIPAFDRAATIGRAIDSVLAQTFADFELLIVDDGSTDDTAQVVEQIDDPRIRLLRQPRNQGAAAARNRGLREARGEYIAFLDSDDEWLPDKLQRQLDRFAELPEDVGLIYTGVQTVDPGGRSSEQPPRHRGGIYRQMLRRNCIHGGGSNAMIRRAAAQQTGFFDEQIPAIEDYDYWLRLCRNWRVDFVPSALIRYHAPPTPRKSEARDDNITAREQFYQRYHHEMRRARAAHLFLLETAGRWLTHPADRRQARRCTLEAAKLRPLSRASAYLALYALLPAGALARLRALRYERRTRGAQ